VFLLRHLSKKVGSCAAWMIMIEVKIRGTQSICAQKHIIAEVAFSRSKLWFARVA